MYDGWSEKCELVTEENFVFGLMKNTFSIFFFCFCATENGLQSNLHLVKVDDTFLQFYFTFKKKKIVSWSEAFRFLQTQ